MIIPKVGEIIHKNDNTEIIFNTYPDFFEEIEEYDEFTEQLKKCDGFEYVEYKIIKEPSDELNIVIDAYNKEQKKLNYNHDKFVESTAVQALSQLSEEYKKYIFDNPDSSSHHFGLSA